MTSTPPEPMAASAGAWNRDWPGLRGAGLEQALRRLGRFDANDDESDADTEGTD
jgi:hypothetical protein